MIGPDDVAARRKELIGMGPASSALVTLDLTVNQKLILWIPKE